ncbi:chitinase [Psychromonas sp. psych-6C06]|uniref:glycosyl hydrolase family 18 protein n=1 Tax=Psychromonas sp. psych-6C06 TaxID=2058089 RepID=UPI000C32F88B|nr:glycosyl hydrolase family 18 protein [Psychromonas sp. psych-6C06]PKF61976.1 chitinase [Psychromonas sp. psych-6C06]
MKKSILTASILSAITLNALASAPSAPILNKQYNNFSLVTIVAESDTYKKQVTRVDKIDLPITWFPAFTGDKGTSWQVLINDEVVSSGIGEGGNTVASITHGGLKEIVVRACNNEGCTDSERDMIVIADTDGSHLAPLTPKISSDTPYYQQTPDQIVGAYFTESSVYEKEFFIENIPATNLTHIIYGFIPLCGDNESLKKEDETGWKVLQKNCTDSQDYEMVIHDTFAALGTQRGSEKVMTIDGKAIAFNDIGAGNFGQLMALKQGQPHLTILPSVGGATLSDPFHGFTNKANRDTFVASAKEFLKTWKLFDGLDINWQFPGGGGANNLLGDPVNDGPAYVALMQELRVMLDELSAETGRQYELTTAIGVSWDKLQDVDYAQAAQYLDNIFMMPNNLTSEWATETGHPSALYCSATTNTEQCEGIGEFAPSAQSDQTAPDYAPLGRPSSTVANATRLLLAQGVPADKLVLGTSMHGLAWLDVQIEDGITPSSASGHPLLDKSVLEFPNQSGIIDYHESLKYIVANPNANYYWDEQAQASFSWDSLGKVLIAYDTPQSIAARGDFLQQQGLGGMVAWHIDGDGGNEELRLLNAMNKAVGNIKGELAPTPTPTSIPTIAPTPIAVTPTLKPNAPVVIYHSNAGPDIKVEASFNATTVTLSGLASTVQYSLNGDKQAITDEEVKWTKVVAGEPDVVISNELVTTVTLASWMPSYATCPNIQKPRQIEYQLTVGNDTDSVIISQDHIMLPLACPTPSLPPQPTIPPTVSPTPPPTPLPITGTEDIMTFTLGETLVKNGDIVRYADSCFEAKNNPGKWETPRSGSWFWNDVACEQTPATPTPPATPTAPLQLVTPTPTPTITLTPTLNIDYYYHSILYNSDAGEDVIVEPYDDRVVILDSSQSTWKASYTYDFQPAGFGEWKAITPGAPAPVTVDQRLNTTTITLDDWAVTNLCTTDDLLIPQPPVRTYQYELTVGTSSDTMTVTQYAKMLQPNCSGAPQWNADSIYQKGDEVVMNDITYIASWWTQGDKPDTSGEWGAWRVK